jgi:hypothetical protein
MSAWRTDHQRNGEMWINVIRNEAVTSNVSWETVTCPGLSVRFKAASAVDPCRKLRMRQSCSVVSAGFDATLGVV